MTTMNLPETDLRLRGSVTRQLDWDPEVDDSAVGVAAQNGVVTLTGYIDSYSGKLAAERAAKRVHGVRAVANDIEVRWSRLSVLRRWRRSAEGGGRGCWGRRGGLPEGPVMTTFTHRVLGAALLDARIYEEVEADGGATRQAVALVLLAGVAGGIGLRGFGAVQDLVTGVIAALVGWIAWATLTYLIGTRFLPEPQTRADVGQLLRTLAFASAPGVLRALGVIPFLGFPMYAVASAWMLVAMIVAVRQALDYNSTGRAVAVCAVGWALSLVLAAIIANLFAPSVS